MISALPEGVEASGTAAYTGYYGGRATGGIRLSDWHWRIRLPHRNGGVLSVPYGLGRLERWSGADGEFVCCAVLAVAGTGGLPWCGAAETYRCWSCGDGRWCCGAACFVEYLS